MNRLQYAGLSLLFVNALGITASAQQVPETIQIPADPGIPIGCLLTPTCGGNLFVSQNGKRVRPQAPVDRGQGMPCLFDPHCSAQPDDSGKRQALFRHPVTIEDVARKDTKIGDYIPLELKLSDTVRALPQMSNETSRIASCTASIVGADEASRNVQNLPTGFNHDRRTAVAVVASAYAAALEACAHLR